MKRAFPSSFLSSFILLPLALTAWAMLCSFSMEKVEAVLERAYAAEDGQRYEEAIKIYEQALTMLPKDSVTWISDINSSLLVCHLRLGHVQKGLTCGETCLRLDEQMADKERIASSLSNLASVMVSANRLELAESYLLRSIKIERERKAEDKLAIRLGMLAEVYTKMQRPEKALVLAREALELDERGGREGKAAIRMSQYGHALVSLKRCQEALPYLLQALSLHRKHENFTSEAITLSSIGMAENALHHTSQAEDYLQQCIAVSERVGVVHPLMTAHMELSHIYNTQGDPRAYEHLLKYNVLKDSLASVQVQQQISDLEVKYETKEKEQELQHKEVLIERQRVVYIALAIVLLLTLALVAFLIIMLRLKNQNMALKDRLMQVVSHDLKNPAIAHQRALHILSRSIDVLSIDEVRTMAQSMAEDADAHVNLVYTLLDWAGLQTGRLHYTPVTLDLVAVCEEVIAQHRAQASTKGVTVKLTAAAADNDGTPQSSSSGRAAPQPNRSLIEAQGNNVVADRQMVEGMVRNLLSNAIKFTPADSEVTVSIVGTTLTIEDRGAGLGAESTEAGTGLGLNLVRQLADINKVAFTLTSRKEGGTTATLKF